MKNHKFIFATNDIDESFIRLKTIMKKRSERLLHYEQNLKDVSDLIAYYGVTLAFGKYFDGMEKALNKNFDTSAVPPLRKTLNEWISEYRENERLKDLEETAAAELRTIEYETRKKQQEEESIKRGLRNSARFKEEMQRERERDQKIKEMMNPEPRPMSPGDKFVIDAQQGYYGKYYQDFHSRGIIKPR